jgi:hypothetical protein
MPRKGQKEDIEDEEELEETEEGSEEEEGEEGEEEYEQPGTRINITAESISAEIPRDGNEAKALNGLAEMVEGLSS